MMEEIYGLLKGVMTIMRSKIWLEIFPGFALKAVILKEKCFWFFGWYDKVLHRDLNGKCGTSYEYSGAEKLIPRTL